MSELYKVIVEKGGIFGIISIMSIILLTTIINAIRTSQLDKNDSYLFWLHLLKSVRLIILVPTLLFFAIEFFKVIDKSLADRELRSEKHRQTEERLKQQQADLEKQRKKQEEETRQKERELEERKKRQDEDARIKLQQAEERKKEVYELEKKAKEKEIALKKQQEAIEASKKRSVVPIKSNGLNNGDCCTIYHPYSNQVLALRSRTLNSYETARMNECRECSDSEYINQNTDIGDLYHGTRVTYLGKYGKWYKIRLGNTVGYMSATFAGLNTLKKC